MFVHAQLKAQCSTKIQDMGYVSVKFLADACLCVTWASRN